MRLFGGGRKPKEALEARFDRLEERQDDLERELERLEAALEYLGDDVKKLRGRVTGGLRPGKSLQDAPGGTNDGAPVARHSPAWFAQERARLRMSGGDHTGGT